MDDTSCCFAQSIPFILLKDSSKRFSSGESRAAGTLARIPAARPVLSDPFSLIGCEVVHDHNRPRCVGPGRALLRRGRSRRWQRWWLPPPQERRLYIPATFMLASKVVFSYLKVARHRALCPLSTTRPRHAAPTTRWSSPSRPRRQTALGSTTSETTLPSRQLFAIRPVPLPPRSVLAEAHPLESSRLRVEML